MFFKDSLEDRVDKAKEDGNELNSLIEEYKPFIASSVQKRTNRFVRYGYDDELTIGMLAFKEAIDSYDREKGKFLSFAKQVINLRMIDYYRKNKKENNVLYLEGLSGEDEDTTFDYSSVKALEEYKGREENEIRKYEIMEYKRELEKWGIAFTDLVDSSPKQNKVREMYKSIARIIVANNDILNSLVSTKRLPIKEIQKNIPIHRKKLERGRIYIIALVIVMKGQYQYMKEYIDWR